MCINWNKPLPNNIYYIKHVFGFSYNMTKSVVYNAQLFQLTHCRYSKSIYNMPYPSFFTDKERHLANEGQSVLTISKPCCFTQ